MAQNYTAGQTQATPTPTSTPATTSTATPTTEATSAPTSTPTNTPEPPPASGYTVTQRMTMSLAGQPIAVRAIIMDENGSVITSRIRYLLTDHLGSTSQVVYHYNNEVVEGSTARYKPFGDYRTTPTNDDTDMGFTGHKENRDIGLTYMNARFYVPYINRFLTADTIVPEKGDPQALNRYSYVRNNPLKLVDESGHCWGIARGLRNTFYSTTCNNLDQALTIVQHSDANVGEKAFAGGYILIEGVAHACAAFCLPGAAVAQSATGTATVATVGTAVCANDGDCTNEAVMTANGVSNVIQTVSADGDPTNEINSGLSVFSRAAEFGIKSYNSLRNSIKGTGLQAHHIVEKRFAETLGVKASQMQSVALTPQEHQVFTNAWRAAIPYGTNYSSLSKDFIWQTAQNIYANHPELLEAARITIFGQ